MLVSLTILAWFVAFIACILIGLIIYATWNYGKLDGLGFPVIKPYLFFGSNYMEPYRVQSELNCERQEKYGTIYGAYDGRTPVIYITDPKMLRLIRTVDSDYFLNNAFDFGGDPMGKEFLDVLRGDKWKVVRSALTPIFTSVKIRQVSRICKDFGDAYAEDLIQKAVNGKIEKFNMKEYCPPLIIESLAKSFIGIEFPNAKDPNNALLNNIRDSLYSPGVENWVTNLKKIFPFVLNFMSAFDFGNMDFIQTFLKSSLESRLNFENKSNDVANIFAKMLGKVRDGDKEYKSLGITETTIFVQIWAGFLSSLPILDALVGLSYELSKNSEIQEQIHNEIINSDGGEELLKSMPIVSACVNEILRLHVTADKPVRVCNRTWKYEGITIPRGIQVYFPISAVHYNPKYFPEPKTFKPERFLDKENPIDPNLINTFGQGPRSCIGSRLSIEIIKVFLISFVKKFKFVSRPDTEYIKSNGGAFTVPAKPVYVDLITR